MNDTAPKGQMPQAPPSSRKSGCRRGCFWGCAGTLLLLLVLLGAVWLFASRAPRSYSAAAFSATTPPALSAHAPGLDGFDSPYLGHTGSWDGKGGAMAGRSKVPDLDKEVAMGLRWTFMPVYWRALEPDGPVTVTEHVPPAWQALDAFVVAAHARKLHILMQAPVMGGNAGGPPKWAGRREEGKSAPLEMEAPAAFAGKLAERYRPGGTLATREKWGTAFGVRAWELDNEPDSYLTHWKGQGADYAEFVTKVAERIKSADTNALIVTVAMPVNPGSLAWLETALDARAMQGSPVFRQRARPFSLGPATDVVAFHIYEGLDTALSGRDRTIERAMDEIRGVFDRWQDRAYGFTYPPKRAYWHTEGNFDFLGILSAPRRAAWRVQFMTRAFAAGVQKVCVMDASPLEQIAIRTYIEALPAPFPMTLASNQVQAVTGRAMAFYHPDRPEPSAGGVWVVWAEAGLPGATVEVPVRHDTVELRRVDGSRERRAAPDRRLRLDLPGDEKMAPPTLVVDRAR